MSEALHITDPTYTPKPKPGPLDALAARLIRDPRDLPFVWLCLSASLVLFPFAGWLFANPDFPWWLGAIYLPLNFFVFFDRYTLMLHNTSHRTMFKREWRWLNQYVPLVLGPFFGQSPYTYYAHHVGMHHPENNLSQDISSTMRFRRDSPLGFARYLGTFLFVGLYQLVTYHHQRGRTRLFRMALLGEAGWLLGVIGLSFLNFRAALVVFIVPYLLSRFLMMAGNWAQHAFLDPTDPANLYRSSITCINTRYNRRCFNDGYHIGHHLSATRHWTDMPGEFLGNLDAYRRERAVIFEGLDYFQIWALLMLGAWGTLAKHFVDLEGNRSKEDIIRMLQERVQPIQEWIPAHQGAMPPSTT